jgi:hypothetical protein
MAISSSRVQEALALVAALAVIAAADDASCTKLTLHNLCSYPVWPLVTANAGLQSIDGVPTRLDGNGSGLATVAFPAGAWSGRVSARTGCSGECASSFPADLQCQTGDAPPVTVAQLSVGGPGGLAAYSVSLVDGFNVPMVVAPHGFVAGKQCPTLGCVVDLAADCPASARGPGGGCGAGASEAATFKARCPETRTTATDVEASPQDCVTPGELKVVFCPPQDCMFSHQ